MADRYPNERDWRQAQRAERIRRGDDVNDDYGQADFTQREPRSFGPEWGGPGRDRVFGEREAGDSYTRGGPARDTRRGYGAERSDYPAERPGGRGYDAGRGDSGGRFYGDDGRERIWREDYGQGGRYYGAVPRGYDAGASQDHWRFGFGLEDAPARPWSGGTDGHDYERGYGDGGHQPGRFERGMRRAGEEVRHWFEAATHRGRGPQGYQRSDERITEEVHERLTEDPWVDASAITVSVSGGEVTLSGSVVERGAKHRAEHLVEDITGVKHVQNNLRIGAKPEAPKTIG